MKNHLLTFIVALFMANVNVVLGQERTVFKKMSLPINYMRMESIQYSIGPKAQMQFISNHFRLTQTGSLDQKVVGTWEQVEYYSSGEFRNTTVKSFSISKEGKMNIYETVSYSTNDNISIYDRNNPSLLYTISVSTRNNILYGMDPESGKEEMMTKYVAGPEYFQFLLDDGRKVLYRRR